MRVQTTKAGPVPCRLSFVSSAPSTCNCDSPEILKVHNSLTSLFSSNNTANKSPQKYSKMLLHTAFLLLLTALPTTLIQARHHRSHTTTGTATGTLTTYTTANHTNATLLHHHHTTPLTAFTITTTLPSQPPSCPTITTLVQRHGACPDIECRPLLSTLTTTFSVGCGCAEATPTVTESVCLDGCLRSTRTVFEEVGGC
ncbi:hypothetical protein BDR22DRAFT_848903 [Usnea florida]